jgi:hypothetical protein
LQEPGVVVSLALSQSLGASDRVVRPRISAPPMNDQYPVHVQNHQRITSIDIAAFSLR